MVILSYANGVISIVKLSSLKGDTITIGSYATPPVTGNLLGIVGLKIFIDQRDKNYVISGTLFTRESNQAVNVGFMMKMSSVTCQ